MAEEEKDPSKISTSSFMSVPANTTVETPAPASARFTWTGGAETIEYQATASHIEVRDDRGALEGMMFSLAYVKVDARVIPTGSVPSRSPTTVVPDRPRSPSTSEASGRVASGPTG